MSPLKLSSEIDPECRGLGRYSIFERPLYHAFQLEWIGTAGPVRAENRDLASVKPPST
jgi:hypothetical protein